MDAYEKMYSALLELCKKEGLRLIEAELEDKNLIYVYFDSERKVVWNKDHSKYKNLCK